MTAHNQTSDDAGGKENRLRFVGCDMSSATDEAAAQPGVRRLQEGDGRMLDATAVRLTSTSQIATPPSK